MAWKDGFVIEYVDNGSGRISCYKCVHFNRDDKSCNRTGAYIPDIGRNYWLSCRSFDLADDYNTVEMREKADQQRARALNKAKSQKRNSTKRNAARKKEQPVGSVPIVKGLHVGRAVCDSQNRTGTVKSLTSTTAIVEFADGTRRQFRVPEDFSDGVIKVQKRHQKPSPEKRTERAEQALRQTEPHLDLDDLLNRLVQSPQYGRGIVVEVRGSIITVAFARGLQRVKFDAITAAKRQSLLFGPVVKRPIPDQPRKTQVAKADLPLKPKTDHVSRAASESDRSVATATKPAAKQQDTKRKRHKASKQDSRRRKDANAKLSDALDNETMAKLEALKASLQNTNL